MGKMEKLGIAFIVIAVITLAVVGTLFFLKPETFLKDKTNQPSSSAPEEAQNKPQAKNTGDTPEIAETVTYTEAGFKPNTITIKKGETVKFDTKREERPMWVASNQHPAHTEYPEFDMAKVLGRFPKPGEDFTFTFEKTGKWGYHDHTDAGNTGVVIVE